MRCFFSHRLHLLVFVLVALLFELASSTLPAATSRSAISSSVLDTRFFDPFRPVFARRDRYHARYGTAVPFKSHSGRLRRRGVGSEHTDSEDEKSKLPGLRHSVLGMAKELRTPGHSSRSSFEEPRDSKSRKTASEQSGANPANEAEKAGIERAFSGMLIESHPSLKPCEADKIHVERQTAYPGTPQPRISAFGPGADQTPPDRPPKMRKTKSYLHGVSVENPHHHQLQAYMDEAKFIPKTTLQLATQPAPQHSSEQQSLTLAPAGQRKRARQQRSGASQGSVSPRPIREQSSGSEQESALPSTSTPPEQPPGGSTPTRKSERQKNRNQEHPQ